MPHGAEADSVIWRAKVGEDLVFRAPPVRLVNISVTFSRIKPNYLHGKFILPLVSLRTIPLKGCQKFRESSFYCIK